MKEAAGEANVTVITIVLIGLVAAVGAILIPRLLERMAVKSACSTYRPGRYVKKVAGTYRCIDPNDETKYASMGKCDQGPNSGEWMMLADKPDLCKAS